MATIFLVSVIFLILAFVGERADFLDKINFGLETDILSYNSDFEGKISDVATDVFLIEDLIASHNALELENDNTVFVDSEMRAEIEDVVMAWLHIKHVYDQIRLIDNNGQEILRANYNNGNPTIVAVEDLQNKSGRYYFENSILLPENYLYISKLDLNVENGDIEVVDGEYKPMLRVATTIFDENGVQLGLLIVNYLAIDIFDSLNDLIISDYSNFEVINEDGYYLKSLDDSIEYGFMFDDKQDEVVSKYHDVDVLSLTASSVVHLTDDDELYTLISVSEENLSKKLTTVVGDQVVVISESGDFIIFGEVEFTKIPEYRFIINLYILLAIIIVFVSYLVAKTIDISSFAKEEKMKMLEYTSKHDLLTGLPNRANIFELIEYKLKRNHEMTVMFLDFDGFKVVNDMFGHDIGDLALIEGSKRLVNSIRMDDVAARIGGDEFVILLNNLNDKTVVTRIANDIISSFKEDFVFGDIKTNMGISIGIIINEDYTDVEEIVKASDDAMYVVKNSTKNSFHFHKK